MVGLKEFGEAAWACEQLYNTRLAEQRAPETDLLRFHRRCLRRAGRLGRGHRRRPRAGPRRCRAVGPCRGAAPAHVHCDGQRPCRPPRCDSARPRRRCSSAVPETAAAPADLQLDLRPAGSTWPRPSQRRRRCRSPTRARPVRLDCRPTWAPAFELRPATCQATPACDIGSELDPALRLARAVRRRRATDSTRRSTPGCRTLGRSEAGTAPMALPSCAEPRPVEPTARPRAAAPASSRRAASPPTEPRPADASEAACSALPNDEQVKVIGDLRIGIPLFNIYLNEADELSRRLGTELAEWAMELHRPVGETHGGAGPFAGRQFGHGGLHRPVAPGARARACADALASRVGHGTPDEAQLFSRRRRRDPPPAAPVRRRLPEAPVPRR